jgi:precorrin-6A synthase
VRTIVIVGIGAGDPDHLTLQGVRVIAAAEVFFVVDKGDQTRDLVALREEILGRHAGPDHRVVAIPDPPRRRDATDYGDAVDEWRRQRAELFGAAIRDELAEDGTGAILVWGDPAVYDSTVAVLDEVRNLGIVDIETAVVPGVSSVTTLAARHGITLNRVGRPFLVTTGRRLAEGIPEGVDDVVVMLDAQAAFRQFAQQEVDIYWGAYLGTPDEILIAGPVRDVATRIVEARAAARVRKGWIMDTYLLRWRTSH